MDTWLSTGFGAMDKSHGHSMDSPPLAMDALGESPGQPMDKSMDRALAVPSMDRLQGL